MASEGWKTEVELVEENPDTDGKNGGGLVVRIASADGATKIEVDRVAFVRKNGRDPKKGFKDALDATLATARAAISAISEVAVANEAALEAHRVKLEAAREAVRHAQETESAAAAELDVAQQAADDAVDDAVDDATEGFDAPTGGYA